MSSFWKLICKMKMVCTRTQILVTCQKATNPHSNRMPPLAVRLARSFDWNFSEHAGSIKAAHSERSARVVLQSTKHLSPCSIPNVMLSRSSTDSHSMCLDCLESTDEILSRGETHDFQLFALVYDFLVYKADSL